MIEIKDLAFSYGQFQVLTQINLDLKEGCIYGLLGENGVGKTTLLTLLAGLKKPTNGSINVDGMDPFDRKPSFLSNIYYLSDEVPAMRMTATVYAQNYGQFWEKFSMDKFNEIMKIFDTNPDMRMDQMSYGQLKKAFISFALATSTRYLFMDEPTNGLDIPSKAQFRKAITKYTSDDSTLLISTHQARDLETIIDPIIILDRRDVLLNATVEEISQKLYFDYSSDVQSDALYSEMIPGGCIQVVENKDGLESKVNIEALFNTTLNNKERIKNMFKN